MTSISDIVRYCEKIAPFDTAAEWDNIGLLAGSGISAVTKAMLALDMTPAAVREAYAEDAQLIISHHPVIFDPLKKLEPDSAVYLLAKYGIAALCLHTNLDRAEQGVNTALAAALELNNTVFYPDDYILVGEPARPMSADEFAVFIKDRLGAPSVRYTDGRVSRAAVSSGGGGDGVELSARYGFDAFVTGEIKHHQYIYAQDHGIAAFDAGHYPTENVVIRPLRNMLSDRFPDVEFFVSKACVCPYKSI